MMRSFMADLGVKLGSASDDTIYLADGEAMPQIALSFANHLFYLFILTLIRFTLAVIFSQVRSYGA